MKVEDTGTRLIATNPKARQDFHLEEIVEAGIVLTGTEIKSIRSQSPPNIKDAFVEISSKGSSLEAWLLNSHIGPYTHGNIWNHDPLRRRKLLLKASQIQKIFGEITQGGMTVVATRMYFKKGLVKVEVALAKGKKAHDKRSDTKKKEVDREIQQALKSSRRSG